MERRVAFDDDDEAPAPMIVGRDAGFMVGGFCDGRCDAGKLVTRPSCSFGPSVSKLLTEFS